MQRRQEKHTTMDGGRSDTNSSVSDTRLILSIVATERMLRETLFQMVGAATENALERLS